LNKLPLPETSLNLILIDPILNAVDIVKAHISAGLKKLPHVRGLSFVLMFTVGLFLSTPRADAQASHTATVNVSQIAVVGVSSGVVSLSITGAGVVAGVNQMTATDQSTTMSWGANTSTAKIAVKTSLVVQKYTLQVQAINITGVPSSSGITAPVVTLTTTSTDFMTGIGLKRGTCNLLYTGTALASAGVGSDSHTITFTITN
jgi:hypothetical protein